MGSGGATECSAPRCALLAGTPAIALLVRRARAAAQVPKHAAGCVWAQALHQVSSNSSYTQFTCSLSAKARASLRKELRLPRPAAWGLERATQARAARVQGTDKMAAQVLAAQITNSA